MNSPNRLKTKSLTFWNVLQAVCLFSIMGVLVDCALVNLEELQYTTYPGKWNQIIALNEPVWIEFSIPLEKDLTESRLRISSYSGKQNGDLYWIGERLYFRSVTGWEPGKQYLFSFDGQVRSTDGRNFSVKHTLHFYAGTDDLPPTITNVKPNLAAGDETDIHTSLQLTFSKPIDKESFKKAFSLTPSIEYTRTWNTENTAVTIIPFDQWTNLQLYTWQINTTLKDVQGLALFQAFSGSFLPASDRESPFISYVVPAPGYWGTGLPATPIPEDNEKQTLDKWIRYNDVIQICFSEAVRFETLQKAFSLEIAGGTKVNGTLYELPGQEGPPYPSRFFIFKPQSYFLKDKLYHLFINRSVEDTSGNQLCPEYHDWFRANIPALEVESISFLNVTGATFNENQLSTYEPKLIPYPEGADSLNYRVEIKFKATDGFNGLTNNTATTQALINAISFPSIFPSLNPFEIQDINIIGNQFYAFRINFACYSNKQQGEDAYYKFTIKGGPDSFRSDDGAYLKEDVFIYLKIKGTAS